MHSAFVEAMRKFNQRPLLNRGDMDFIADTLCMNSREVECIKELCKDFQSMDQILDAPELHDALLDNPASVNISMELYFYVIIRHALVQMGVDDRDLAAYVANLMAEFAHKDIWRRPLGESDADPLYSVDLLKELESVGAERRFNLLLFIGNHFLALTGLFPSYLEKRRSKGAPGLDFYESVGSHSFRAARDLPLARQFGMDELLEQLSATFHSTRLAMNGVSEKVLFLGAN